MNCDCLSGACTCPGCLANEPRWEETSASGMLFGDGTMARRPWCERCGGSGTAHCCEGDQEEGHVDAHLLE